jgi:hypothetical protein
MNNTKHSPLSKDNVNFIVTACNNHYELLETCKKIESMELVDKIKVEYGDLMMLISAMKATARLAIAKAEGK